jgi:hypothetical protein
LPVVWYGFVTWSVIVRVEHRLRMLKNSVLRKTSGPKRDDVTGECKRLHKEELYNLYFSPNVIQVIKSRSPGWGV